MMIVRRENLCDKMRTYSQINKEDSSQKILENRIISLLEKLQVVTNGIFRIVSFKERDSMFKTQQNNTRKMLDLNHSLSEKDFIIMEQSEKIKSFETGRLIELLKLEYLEHVSDGLVRDQFNNIRTEALELGFRELQSRIN